MHSRVHRKISRKGILNFKIVYNEKIGINYLQLRYVQIYLELVLFHIWFCIFTKWNVKLYIIFLVQKRNEEQLLLKKLWHIYLKVIIIYAIRVFQVKI